MTDISLHILPSGTILLRDLSTLHFLAPSTLIPQRQPASFDFLASIRPRPHDPSAFACIQVQPNLALSVWRFVSGNSPDDLTCVIPRVDVSLSSPSSVVSCWSNDGSKMLIVISDSLLALLDIPFIPPSVSGGNSPLSAASKVSIQLFNTPDNSDVLALCASPHSPHLFAVACASGKTYYASFDATTENASTSDPEILHVIPDTDTDLSSRPVLALAFHPTSVDPDALMLAICFGPEEQSLSAKQGLSGGLTAISPQHEIQLWCVSERKSVSLIRRLHPPQDITIAEETAANSITSHPWMKWSKNGRVVHYLESTIIIYDVRRNNGARETLSIPARVPIVAMDLMRETGVAWVLDASMDLHVYDLLEGIEHVRINISENEAESSVATLSRAQPSNDVSEDLPSDAREEAQGSSFGLLSYYLDEPSPGTPQVGAEGAIHSAASDRQLITGEPTTSVVYPVTAIRATASPLMSFAEQSILATRQELAEQVQQVQQQLLDPTGPLMSGGISDSPSESPALPLSRAGAEENQLLQQPTTPMSPAGSGGSAVQHLPEAILPDCMFMNVGELMQDSPSGLEMNSKVDATDVEVAPNESTLGKRREFLEILFGIPSHIKAETALEIVKWERECVAKEQQDGNRMAMFILIVLDQWLAGVEATTSEELQSNFRDALTKVQSDATTRGMTVSMVWLIFAMYIAGSNSNGESIREMVHSFIVSALGRDRPGYGDDVEAVHLSTGMLIASGSFAEARDLLVDNAYYLEGTLVSLLFGLPVAGLLDLWQRHAMDIGAESIATRCRNALAWVSANVSSDNRTSAVTTESIGIDFSPIESRSQDYHLVETPARSVQDSIERVEASPMVEVITGTSSDAGLGIQKPEPMIIKAAGDGEIPADIGETKADIESKLETRESLSSSISSNTSSNSIGSTTTTARRRKRPDLTLTLVNDRPRLRARAAVPQHQEEVHILGERPAYPKRMDSLRTVREGTSNAATSAVWPKSSNDNNNQAVQLSANETTDNDNNSGVGEKQAIRRERTIIHGPTPAAAQISEESGVGVRESRDSEPVEAARQATGRTSRVTTGSGAMPRKNSVSAQGVSSVTTVGVSGIKSKSIDRKPSLLRSGVGSMKRLLSGGRSNSNQQQLPQQQESLTSRVVAAAAAAAAAVSAASDSSAPSAATNSMSRSNSTSRTASTSKRDRASSLSKLSTTSPTSGSSSTAAAAAAAVAVAEKVLTTGSETGTGVSHSLFEAERPTMSVERSMSGRRRGLFRNTSSDKRKQQQYSQEPVADRPANDNSSSHPSRRALNYRRSSTVVFPRA
ncbi:uncharacterized protein V1516DRAFT_665174 [Lipomyces oligophaga]|uniref:uncharacterized protein n=1 Tax=Lipomyces oligophaga TaxID=45792 RepID=UPI0034CE13EF